VTAKTAAVDKPSVLRYDIRSICAKKEEIKTKKGKAMASSMTGFGRAEKAFKDRVVAIEFKSVNHRYFEFSSRTPRGFGSLDEKLKNLVQTKISRGKIDANVSVTTVGLGDVLVRINRPLVETYIEQLRTLGPQLSLSDDLTLSNVAKMPDAFAIEKAAVDEDAVVRDVIEVASEALERIAEMRRNEGERLKSDILMRLETIEMLVARVEEISPRTLEDYRQRLRQKITEVLSEHSIDEARILTEVAIFSDRIAIDEETVRLRSHLTAFRDILSQQDAVGRKLDFLAQELNREINTVGSKAQDAAMTGVVIEIKSEMEKVREQIQNIE
jgi:uncharacterized protein (TIGR00255 family)